MALKKVKRKAVSQNPKTMLLYGAPKVGKTTALSQLDDCLIIDTESGANMIDGYVETVNSREDLIKLLKEAKEGHEFKYAAIDTIDKMLANTDKIYTLYDKARSVVEKEEESSTKGDATLSLSDSNEI